MQGVRKTGKSKASSRPHAGQHDLRPRKRITAAQKVLTKLSGLMKPRVEVAEDEPASLKRTKWFLENWERPSYAPLCVPRSTLETLILFQARVLVWGIDNVVIEDVGGGERTGGNWRVAGIAFGAADRERAADAVASAARKYAGWAVVDESDTRAGMIVSHGGGGDP